MTSSNGNKLTGLIIVLLLSAWAAIFALYDRKADAKEVGEQITQTQKNIAQLVSVVEKLTLAGCLDKHDKEYCLNLWGHGPPGEPE